MHTAFFVHFLQSLHGTGGIQQSNVPATHTQEQVHIKQQQHSSSCERQTTCPAVTVEGLVKSIQIGYSSVINNSPHIIRQAAMVEQGPNPYCMVFVVSQFPCPLCVSSSSHC